MQGQYLHIRLGPVKTGLIMAVYDTLKADEIIVMGHHDCGIQSIDPNLVLDKMKERGISRGNFRCTSILRDRFK